MRRCEIPAADASREGDAWRVEAPGEGGCGIIRCVPPRFYLPSARASGIVAALPDDEAQHATRVLRLGAGAAIRVFDGRGHEFDAEIEHAGKTGVLVRVGPARSPVAEPRVAVTLMQAVLKGDKMDDVVRDAVMMGVAAIQPIVTARSEITLAALARSHRRERWERVAVSSAKQCGRAVVPPVLEPREFPGDWVVAGWNQGSHTSEANSVLDADRASEHESDVGPTFMLVEPGSSAERGSARTVSLSALDPTVPRRATILIGPEGGWTPEEVDRGGAVGCLVTMGARTLRADSMAVVALAALFAVWKEF